MELIEQGLTLNKELIPNFYLNKAICLDSLGDYPGAIAVLEEGQKRFPYNIDFPLSKNLIQQSVGDYDKAYETIKECLSFEPTYATHHLQLTLLAEKAGSYAHIMLPIITSMLLAPESETNPTIMASLERLVASKPVEELIEFDVEMFDEDFSEVNNYIGNYIALSDKYEVPGKFQGNFIKQFHLLISEIENHEGKFFSDTYVQFYKDILAKNQFEYLAALLYLNSEDKNHNKFIEKNTDKIIEVSTALRTHLEKLALNKDAPKELGNRKVDYISNDNDRLYLIGDYNEKTESFSGDIILTNEEGSISSKGTYNDKGEATGPWKWYYPNGELARESTFKNDKLDGKTITYEKDGKVNGTYEFKEDLQHGKTEYFKLIGYKYEERTFVDGKENGTRIGFYPDGSRYYELSIKNDLEDGPYKYFYEDGTLQVEGI